MSRAKKQQDDSASVAPTIVMLAPDELAPYERNARTHSAEQITAIARSIKQFGFNNPILIDSAKGIIAGHGRLLAARELGLAQVPVLELSHLSDAEKRAYIIADNQLALQAGWDMPLLAQEVEALAHDGIDITLLGFSDKEMSLLERLGASDAPGSEQGTNQYGGNRYLLLVEFDSEQQLQEEFEALQKRGLRVKVME